MQRSVILVRFNLRQRCFYKRLKTTKNSTFGGRISSTNVFLMLIYNKGNRKENENFPKFDKGLSIMLFSNKQVTILKLEKEIRYKLEIATFRHYAKSGHNLFKPQIISGCKCLIVTDIPLILNNFCPLCIFLLCSSYHYTFDHLLNSPFL